MVQGGGDMKESIKIAAGLALLAAAMFFVLSISGAEAAYWNDKCLDNETMESTLYIESNATVLLNLTNPISCGLPGCNNITGRCNLEVKDVSVDSMALLIGTILAVSVILVVISFNIKKSYTAMGMLYLIFPLIFMIVALSFSAMAITSETQTPFQEIIAWISYAVIAILIITILIFIFKIFRDFATTANKKKAELKEL
jgi:amino acid transporter